VSVGLEPDSDDRQGIIGPSTTVSRGTITGPSNGTDPSNEDGGGGGTLAGAGAAFVVATTGGGLTSGADAVRAGACAAGLPTRADGVAPCGTVPADGNATLAEFGVAATREVLACGVGAVPTAASAAGLVPGGGGVAPCGTVPTDDRSSEVGATPGAAATRKALSGGAEAAPAPACTGRLPAGRNWTNNTAASAVPAVPTRISSADRRPRPGARFASRCEPDIELTVPGGNRRVHHLRAHRRQVARPKQLLTRPMNPRLNTLSRALISYAQKRTLVCANRLPASVTVYEALIGDDLAQVFVLLRSITGSSVASHDSTGRSSRAATCSAVGVDSPRSSDSHPGS
jgi:hypothetical protein